MRRSLPKCRCVSSSAASRLCADVMAWKSPLKCRLILSTGCSDALPPPVAPPFCRRPARATARAAPPRRVAALHQALRQADGVHRLALAAGRRSDGGDEDELAAAGRKTLECVEADLGGVAAVGFEQVLGQAEAFSDDSDGLHGRRMIPRRPRRLPERRTGRRSPAGVLTACDARPIVVARVVACTGVLCGTRPGVGTARARPVRLRRRRPPHRRARHRPGPPGGRDRRRLRGAHGGHGARGRTDGPGLQQRT